MSRMILNAGKPYVQNIRGFPPLELSRGWTFESESTHYWGGGFKSIPDFVFGDVSLDSEYSELILNEDGLFKIEKEEEEEKSNALEVLTWGSGVFEIKIDDSLNSRSINCNLDTGVISINNSGIDIVGDGSFELSTIPSTRDSALNLGFIVSPDGSQISVWVNKILALLRTGIRRNRHLNPKWDMTISQIGASNIRLSKAWAYRVRRIDRFPEGIPFSFELVETKSWTRSSATTDFTVLPTELILDTPTQEGDYLLLVGGSNGQGYPPGHPALNEGWTEFYIGSGGGYDSHTARGQYKVSKGGETVIPITWSGSRARDTVVLIANIRGTMNEPLIPGSGTSGATLSGFDPPGKFAFPFVVAFNYKGSNPVHEDWETLVNVSQGNSRLNILKTSNGDVVDVLKDVTFTWTSTATRSARQFAIPAAEPRPFQLQRIVDANVVGWPSSIPLNVEIHKNDLIVVASVGAQAGYASATALCPPEGIDFGYMGWHNSYPLRTRFWAIWAEGGETSIPLSWDTTYFGGCGVHSAVVFRGSLRKETIFPMGTMIADLNAPGFVAADPVIPLYLASARSLSPPLPSGYASGSQRVSGNCNLTVGWYSSPSVEVVSAGTSAPSTNRRISRLVGIPIEYSW